MFERLDKQKPALKKLIAALRKNFPYASVLATAERYRSWRVSKNGISLSASGLDGGDGYVIRVFDKTGCAEYSINAFSEEMIPAIVKEMQVRFEAERKALPLDITPMPTAILPFAATWMDLEGIIISAINKTEENKYCVISLIHGT